MTNHDDHFRDAELGPVIDRLEAERPMATPLELDAIKQRVRGRAGRSRRTEKSMKSRIAILATLALGMVLSTGGAGLAVSGFASQSDNAAEGQYGNASPTPGGGNGGNDVLGEEESGGPSGGGNEGTPAGGENQSQPARQVEAGAQGESGGDEQLPFTGFAAIPVLLGGVALLTTGLVLRRRTGSEE